MGQRKSKIGWSASHREFIVSDHYYFSHLENLLQKNGYQLEEVEDFSRLGDYDVIVFNYPEDPFSDMEMNLMKEWLKDGKKIIYTSYYKDEDNVSDVLNDFLKDFGFYFRRDIVKDAVNNYNGDELFVVTSNVDEKLSRDIEKVLLPCSASIKIVDGDVVPLVRAEETATSSSGVAGSELVLVASKKAGNGEIIAVGTAVFWDNYSIDKFSNKNFILRMIGGEF